MGRDHRWLTVADYAEAMGMHPATVRRLCVKGELPAEKTGATWRIYYEPPGQVMRLDEATEDAVSASVTACTAVLDAAITALQSMKAEMINIKEETCRLA